MAIEKKPTPNPAPSAPPPIAPLGFFTMDAARAGWYLVWRVALYTIPFWLIPFVLSFVIFATIGNTYISAIVFCVGVIGGITAFCRRCGSVASQWAESRWGSPLPDEGAVWLDLLWPIIKATFLAGAAMSPLTIAAASGSGFLLAILALIQMVVFVVATGWAMSKVAAKQLTTPPE